MRRKRKPEPLPIAAYAVPCGGGGFVVTYSPAGRVDRNTPISDLESLAARGVVVFVAAGEHYPRGQRWESYKGKVIKIDTVWDKPSLTDGIA